MIKKNRNKDLPTIATPSKAYLQMLPKWNKIQTLLDGTEAMRLAERTFLPQHQGESNWAYSERLNRSVLLNMTKMTLDSWVGKPFSSPITIGDDVPEQLKGYFDNIDLQGNSLNVFGRNWFRNGVAKGFSGVLVDFPRPSAPANGVERTLEDDNRDKLRPYFVQITPENLIFAHREIIDGVEQFTQVRIAEQHTEIDGFGEKTVNKIRQIEPNKVTIWVEVPDPEDPKGKRTIWKVEEEYPYALDFIPLEIFYSDRQDFMISNPPIEDLADLNIQHWQSRSDQIAVLTVARFPIMACSGAIGDTKLVVGPNEWLNVPDPAGRFYYVEHSGKAINTGRVDLQDLESVMAEYGAIFLMKRPGGATATASALKTAEVTSPLQDMTIRFNQSLQRVLTLLGQWVNIDKVGTLTMNTDFGLEAGDLPHLTALGQGREFGDISRVRYLKELHRFGVLGEDFSYDDNQKELDKEKATPPLPVIALPAAPPTPIESPPKPLKM